MKLHTKKQKRTASTPMASSPTLRLFGIPGKTCQQNNLSQTRLNKRGCFLAPFCLVLLSYQCVSVVPGSQQVVIRQTLIYPRDYYSQYSSIGAFHWPTHVFVSSWVPLPSLMSCISVPLFLFFPFFFYLVDNISRLVSNDQTNIPKACYFGKKKLATLSKKTTKLLTQNTAHLASSWKFLATFSS